LGRTHGDEEVLLWSGFFFHQGWVGNKVPLVNFEMPPISDEMFIGYPIPSGGPSRPTRTRTFDEEEIQGDEDEDEGHEDESPPHPFA
jgi:hypothetical protein